jgi:TonB family protein
MGTLAKCAVVALFLPMLTLGQTAAAVDPAGLLKRAERLLATARIADDVIILQVIPLLRQANAIWEASSSDVPQYAESLDLLAILLRREAHKDAKKWQAEAAPLVSRALEIREERAGGEVSAALALALELQADLLGQEFSGASAGAVFANRAFRIRDQLVAAVGQRAAPATSPGATPPAILRVGGDVSQPSIITRVAPQYSEIARLTLYRCNVLLSVVVDSDGIPGNPRLARGCGYGLDERAAEAVLKWRFRPAVKGDQPVNVRAQILVHFRAL